MKNEIQIFNNTEFGNVRVVEIENKPWFIGKDVAEILGYTNANEAIQDHIDAEDKLNSKTLSSFELDLGQRGGWLINESGLYSLILSSKMPNAKKFKHWVTSDVLPSIRRHGLYAVDDIINNPDLGIAALTALKEEREKRRVLEQKNEELRPKALFADAVNASQSSILIGDLAKLIKQNGVDIGQKRLFAWLRDNGWLIKSGTSKNMPTQKAMDMGLFQVKENTITNPDGSIRITRTTKVLGKGQTYFVNVFLEKKIVV